MKPVRSIGNNADYQIRLNESIRKQWLHLSDTIFKTSMTYTVKFVNENFSVKCRQSVLGRSVFG